MPLPSLLPIHCHGARSRCISDCAVAACCCPCSPSCAACCPGCWFREVVWGSCPRCACCAGACAACCWGASCCCCCCCCAASDACVPWAACCASNCCTAASSLDRRCCSSSPLPPLPAPVASAATLPARAAAASLVPPPPLLPCWCFITAASFSLSLARAWWEAGGRDKSGRLGQVGWGRQAGRRDSVRAGGRVEGHADSSAARLPVTGSTACQPALLARVCCPCQPWGPRTPPAQPTSFSRLSSIFRMSYRAHCTSSHTTAGWQAQQQGA